MSKLQSVCTLGMLAFALSGAWAPRHFHTTAPSLLRRAASRRQCLRMGRTIRRLRVSENPPLSGLDLPSLEPHAAPLSYLQPGATFSESAESNAGNVAGGGGCLPSAARWAA